MNDRKSLYNEHDEWTETTRRCDQDVRNALTPVFEKWVSLGYSPREIADVIMNFATYEASCTILKLRMERKKG